MNHQRCGCSDQVGGYSDLNLPAESSQFSLTQPTKLDIIETPHAEIPPP